MARGVEIHNETARRLLTAAGYNPNEEHVARGGAFAEEYAQLLLALHYIGNRKVDDYGDFRLQDIRSWDRETWGAYWDIQRKFGRLENQLKIGADFLRAHYPGGDVSPHGLAQQKIVTDLMDTLSDMAVYCVRMIQIHKRLEEKGLVP